MITKNKDGKEEKKALGFFRYKDMTYYKDEGMLILKYCSADCSSKGELTLLIGVFVSRYWIAIEDDDNTNIKGSNSIVFNYSLNRNLLLG